MGTKRQWAILLALIAVLIVVLFSIANVGLVDFNFLFGTVRLPLILLIICSLLFGAVLTGALAYVKMHRQEKQIARLRREIRIYREKDPENPDRMAEESASAGREGKTHVSEPSAGEVGETRASRHRRSLFRR